MTSGRCWAGDDVMLATAAPGSRLLSPPQDVKCVCGVQSHCYRRWRRLFYTRANTGAKIGIFVSFLARSLAATKKSSMVTVGV
jgi:hypothetical protein